MLGFIGAGNLTAFMVTGLCTGSQPWGQILVTNRSIAKAQQLAAKFPKYVQVAESNQAMLDACDTVVLAVRPQDLTQAMQGLQFRPEQTIISAIALKTLAELKALVAPCENIVRVIPLPPCQEHLGRVPYYPANPLVESLLSHLGQGLLLDSEDDMNIITGITGLIAPYYTLIATVSDWVIAHGVKPEVAQSYTVSMFQSLVTFADKPNLDLKDMIHEAATPGGLNEYAKNTLVEQGAFKPFEQVLDGILQRLNKK